jgi:hypothetical protein
MTQLIRAGVVPVCGGVKLFSSGLNPFDLLLGEGWTREGIRAFRWTAPTTAVTPAVTLSPVEPAGVYTIQINVTELSGTTPNLLLSLGGTQIADITAPGAYIYEKQIAGAGSTFDMVISTNADTTGCIVKSLFINRVD